MPRHEIFDKHGFNNLRILRFKNRLEIDRFQITALFSKISALVKYVGHAATHAGGKISPTGSEHQNQAPGHVFATVVADALDHIGRSGVANREPLPSNSIEKRFAAGRAIESNVANQDVVFGGETRPSRRIHDQSSSGETFADVIVGLAFERERDSLS